MAKQGTSSSSGRPRPHLKPPEKEVPVELGFLEEDESSDKYKLKSAFFPSKFGGLPAWLDLKNIPTAADVKCSLCDNPTKFLLQVYAPMDTPDTFHRTLYVFVCTNKTCCLERNSNKNLVALRCQLSQENEFYSSEAPDEKNVSLGEVCPAKFGVKVCKVCGVKSTQNCSLCGVVYYCGKTHQVADWNDGHKELCKNKGPLSPNPVEKFAFKEHALVIDAEVIPKPTSKQKSDKDKLQEYEQLLAEGKAGSLDDSVQTKEMLEAASYRSDKAFNKFKKRINYQPDQVLRYDRRGTPLWVSSEHSIIGNGDVPCCEYCKGPRVFEFQIMPQLLNYVGDEGVVGDLDWGTLAVYTCEKNCSVVGSSSYKKEFIWQQDFKQEGGEKEDQ